MTNKKHILSTALALNTALLILIALIEGIFFKHLTLAGGFAVGSASMMLNLWALMRGFGPVIFEQREVGQAILYSLGGFLLLGVCAFLVFHFFPDALWGFAFGLLCPAWAGLVWGIKTPA